MFCLVAAAESFMLEEDVVGAIGSMPCPLSHDGSVFRACRRALVGWMHAMHLHSASSEGDAVEFRVAWIEIFE